jgi:hypothetical protein
MVKLTPEVSTMMCCTPKLDKKFMSLALAINNKESSHDNP